MIRLLTWTVIAHNLCPYNLRIKLLTKLYRLLCCITDRMFIVLPKRGFEVILKGPKWQVIIKRPGRCQWKDWPRAIQSIQSKKVSLEKRSIYFFLTKNYLLIKIEFNNKFLNKIKPNEKNKYIYIIYIIYQEHHRCGGDIQNE